jgi:hypothetical protein
MIALRSKQRVPVVSTPVGATVIVNGVNRGVTPLELRLARKAKDQIIRIESPGYNPLEIRIKRRLPVPAIMGDIIVGAVPGFLLAIGGGSLDFMDERLSRKWPLIPATAVALSLIDMAVGKKYALGPGYLTVTLTKADGPPRVDRMLVDADEFQSIMWIRVQRD